MKNLIINSNIIPPLQIDVPVWYVLQDSLALAAFVCVVVFTVEPMQIDVLVVLVYVETLA